MPNFSGVWNLKEQIQAIAAGRWTGLPTFELYAWGDGGNGRLGDGQASANFSSPIQIGMLENWQQVAAGQTHSTAVKTDGTLWTWGNNASGRLGDGTIISRSSPVQIGASTNWSQVAAGGDHTAAVKTGGTLWAWGANNEGQLGDGTVGAKSSPVQIGALTNWYQVSANTDAGAAVKTDGTLWAWGRNVSFGRIGDNTTIDKSSPVQIGALTTWAQVSAGRRHTGAIKTDGTLWIWGGNYSGELGIGVAGVSDYRSSPVQVGALTTWAQVSVSEQRFTGAVKTNGTLWMWGDGGQGQLGQNSDIQRSSPVQVGALTNWAQVSLGNNNVAAVKTDGTLWAWGGNNSGKLGDGTSIARSSPVQVGTLTNWAQASANNNHVLALIQETTN